MRREDFTTGAPNRLVDTADGVPAFVPDPLPPSLAPTWDTVQLLSDADRALSLLAGIGGQLPNPQLLIQPFLRREAVLSSRIEGTVTTLRQLLLFEATPSRAATDVLEVRNYVRALELGLNQLNRLPVSLRLIRLLHRQLLDGVRGTDTRPGEFRREQNMIVSYAGQTPYNARFIPPPAAEVMPALHALEAYLHTPSTLPALVRLALIHYQFETIHPFVDGNGRIGRLLITLLLCEWNYLPQPLLYLSAYLERNRTVYMDLLLGVSQRGAWDEWLRFFLRGVAEQARDAAQRADRLRVLQAEYRQRLQTPRSSTLPLQVIDALFANPILTVPGAARLLGVTPRAAQLVVKRLVDAGIVREIADLQRPRTYISDDIFNVIEAKDA